jgi:hypothetical protein
MTVKQLIKQLEDLKDQSARVVIRGYEGGVDDVYGLEHIRIKLDANKEWYYGKHEEWYDQKSEEVGAVSAIRII